MTTLITSSIKNIGIFFQSVSQYWFAHYYWQLFAHRIFFLYIFTSKFFAYILCTSAFWAMLWCVWKMGSKKKKKSCAPLTAPWSICCRPTQMWGSVCLKLNLGLLSERAEQSDFSHPVPSLWPDGKNRQSKVSPGFLPLLQNDPSQAAEMAPFSLTASFYSPCFHCFFLYRKRIQWPDWSCLDLIL